MLFSGEAYPRILFRKSKLGLDDTKSSIGTIDSSRSFVVMCGIIQLLFEDLLDADTLYVPVVDGEAMVGDPFILKTRHSRLAHGELEFLITPFSSICLINFFSSSAKAIETFLRGCLMGLVSPVSILCSTKVVKPKSESHLEKMVAYLQRTS